MNDTLTMRRALPGEADRVMEILEDGKRSIARFGIEQWQHGYPNRTSVEGDLALDACWVAVDASGSLLGTLALRFDEDPEYRMPELTWLTPQTTPRLHALLRRHPSLCHRRRRAQARRDGLHVRGGGGHRTGERPQKP